MPAIDNLLQEAVQRGASDLQLITQAPPVFRISGQVVFSDHEVLTPEVTRQLVGEIMNQDQRAQLAEVGDCDFSYSLPSGERFRINVYRQQGAVAMVARIIPGSVPPFTALGLPGVIADFGRRKRGLVLVTGATGSGKSTTLAAMIRMINEERRCHVVTIEDPVEYVHNHGYSVISQRDVGIDTRSFADALRHVLRQAPDVILVGEMRDLETTSLALTAAETGHLVLSTLHTNDAVQSMDRIIDIFPAAQQDQVRLQLSSTLVGVVCQQLVRRHNGQGRVVATEILVAIPAVRNLIREAKTHQLRSIIQTGQEHGMQTLEQSLAQLVRQGDIDADAAYEICNDREDMESLLDKIQEG